MGPEHSLINGNGQKGSISAIFSVYILAFIQERRVLAPKQGGSSKKQIKTLCLAHISSTRSIAIGSCTPPVDQWDSQRRQRHKLVVCFKSTGPA